MVLIALAILFAGLGAASLGGSDFFRMYFPHTDVDSARRFGRTQL